MLLRILAFVCCLLWTPPVLAAVPDTEPPLQAAAAKKDEGGAEAEEMSPEEKERAAEEERDKKSRLARVIVLRWKDSEADYTDKTVHRNVRSRIDRPDALFFPEVDLYQNGRKLMDKTVVPANQLAVVPDAAIGVVNQAVAEVQNIPYNGLQPYQWGLKAQELQQLVERLWFVDRMNLREPLFMLYAQIGRAAENQNHPSPPFYEQIGAFSVNYYWYMAAVLAQQEPALMSKVTDPDVLATINYYLEQLQRGAFPTIKVDFELDDQWDGEAFNKTYEILFNGLPVEPDQNAQIPIFLGRTDIYLKRKDTGHGLSERLEVSRLEEKYYPVVQNARKRMGIDFIDQLFLHPNECTPDLDGDILNYLSIYAKLHDRAEIYVAVPEDGNPNKVWIWRYDRKAAALSLVGGGPDDFPVRFALVGSIGVLYNGAGVTYDSDLGEQPSTGGAPSTSLLPGTESVSTALNAGVLPISLELRGHYNRLMMAFGAEGGWNLSGEGAGWIEYYQTPGSPDAETTECVDDAKGNCTEATAYNERTLNRYLYLGASLVLGRDAGIGFGPRIGGRFGWMNMPHGYQTTLDAGWSLQPPLWDAGGRFRPLVDIDLRGGVAIARDKSLQLDLVEANIEGEHQVMLVFGATLGIGFTF